MVYYHLQHYFSLDNEWHDIPHINGGCSSCKSDIYEVFDSLLNLNFTRCDEYRIIVSGTDLYFPLPKPSIPIYSQLSLF